MKSNFKLKILILILSLSLVASYQVTRKHQKKTEKFDDPELQALSEEIWGLMQQISLEAGTATNINNKVTALHALVEKKSTGVSDETRTALKADWAEFNSYFAPAAEEWNRVRAEMRKFKELEDAEKAKVDSAEMNDISSQRSEIDQLKNQLIENIASFSAEIAKPRLLRDAAIRGLAASMPPKFCWKRLDFGTIPKGCPSTHPDRSGQLCYKNCEGAKTGHGYSGAKAKYKFKLWGGVCWEDCSTFEGTSGQWEQKGLICSKKSAKGWHWKRSFVTSSVTNFNDGVTCPADMYKVLALCYRDCSKIGYTNCGNGACSIYKSDCAKEIARMAWKSFQGVLKLVGFIASFGATSAVWGTVQTITEAIGKVAEKVDIGMKILEGIEITRTVFRNEKLKKVVLEECTVKAQKLLKNLRPAPTKQEVAAACKGVLDTEVDNQKAQTKIGFDPTSLTLDMIESQGYASSAIGAVKACDLRKKGERSYKTECARAVLETISPADPTGLVGLAAAFIYERCPGDI